MPAQSDYIVEGHPKPHRRAGAGARIVLLHGFLGGSAHWQAEIARFSATHDVIAPDLPGFGEAGAMPGYDRIERMADYLIDLLDDIGVTAFSLLGHSMGGMVAQSVAAKIPDRVHRLILYGTGPLGVMPDRFETLDVSRRRLREDGIENSVRRIAATWLVKREHDPNLPFLASVGDCASVDAALKAFDAMEHWDGRQQLPSLRMPSLILWGDRDRSYRWPQIETLWTGLPNASLAAVPGASHAAHLEKPRVVHAILEDALNEAASQ
ncbi:MAG: alpha/beta fold hydrolase [Pseudomonadota bacterium]